MHILDISGHPAAVEQAACAGVRTESDARRLVLFLLCKQWKRRREALLLFSNGQNLKKEKFKLEKKIYQCNNVGRQMTRQTNKTVQLLKKNTE